MLFASAHRVFEAIALVSSLRGVIPSDECLRIEHLDCMRCAHANPTKQRMELAVVRRVLEHVKKGCVRFGPEAIEKFLSRLHGGLADIGANSAQEQVGAVR